MTFPSTAAPAQTVLLADESQTIRALFRLTVAGQGIQVLTASTGQEALQLVRSRRPQLVLADVRLADLDGYEFCRLVRESDPTVRVVLMAAHQVPYDAQLSREVGAVGFLRKPFDRRALAEWLRPAAADAAPSPGEPPPARFLSHEPGGPVAPAPPRAATGEVELRRAAADGAGVSPVDLAAAVTAAVERQLAEALPRAVEAALPAAVGAALERLAPTALKAVLEPIVWKIVPALAEQMIKEEIERLTAELGEAVDAGAKPEPPGFGE